jgi:hypothetical protein
MKGIRAEPSVMMIKRLRKKRIRKIGASHHFFLSRKKI